MIWIIALTRLFKNPKFILLVTLSVVIPFVTFNLDTPKKSPFVLSASITSQTPLPTATPFPTPTLIPTPTPSPTAPVPSKESYVIAIYGDSMVDTMGEHLEYLQSALQIKYPQTKFKLYNYGIGSQNIAEGLERFNSSFSYQTRSYPPIKEIKADIIIVGSFAYNPFSSHNRDRHWTTLTSLVTEAKSTTADIYMLAEIAPLKSGFGVGPGGVNWPTKDANEQVEKIIQQLENAVALSKSLNVALINAYVFSGTKYGNPTYVSSHDGIHPSQEGHTFMANLIANQIHLK